MRFNTGGNLFFVVDQKNLLIYNAYTLQKIQYIKATNEGIADIAFGERDSSFAIISPDGFIGRYRLPNISVIKEREVGALQTMPTDGKTEERGPVLAFKACDFIPSSAHPNTNTVDGAEEHLFVTAGDQITVLNSKDVALKTYTPLAPMSVSSGYHGSHHSASSSSIMEDAIPPKYSQIKFIKTVSQALGSQKSRVTTGLIAGTDRGNIQIFSYPLNVDAPLLSPLLD